MDFYYSDDDIDDYDEIDEIDVNDEAGEDDLLESVTSDNPRHKIYRSLKPEDIKKLQQKDISDVSNVLSVSRSVACTLLIQNRWMPSSVCDDTWFDRPVVEFQKPETEICNICYEIANNTLFTQCGHLFCVDCWKSYISVSIENGPGCLTLRCPEPGCKSNPGFEMVDLVSSEDDKNKYYEYLYRSYVESSPNRKWCPAPGCDLAIAFDEVKGVDTFDVTCDCGFKFCYNCGFNESHSPLDCDTLVKWTEKNNSEAENTNWILAFTKPCPMCHKSIEKNQGCNHMTCRAPCDHQFCWLCLGPWKNHNKCNAYIEKYNQKLARESLNRYMHYYERWNGNDKSMKMALKDMDYARGEIVDKLVDIQMQSRLQAMVVVDAWEQIVECRRVLKWSYVYGFYRVSGRAKWKSDFFEHLQGEAESALERLHHCAEKEIAKYLSPDCKSEGFDELRGKLVGLANVTKNYFENFVRALENNLEEDESGDRKVKKAQ